jgi:Uncharacterized conserved protein
MYVKDFKAFKEAQITFGPITVIVGPNNSGKSSLIQAINLIQQTLLRNPNNYMFNTNVLDNSSEQNIDAGSFSEIINHNSIDKKLEFKLFFTENHIEFSLRENEEKNVYVSDFHCGIRGFQYSLRNLSIGDYNKEDFNINNIDKFYLEIDNYFDKKDAIKLKINPIVYREGFFFHIASATPAEDSLMSYYKEKKDEQMRGIEFRPDIEDDIVINEIINDIVKSIEQYNKISRCSYKAFQMIKKDFSNIKYIGPIRKTAERSYGIGDFKDLGFGGEHATQVLALERGLKGQVESYFKQMGIAEKIQIYLREDTQRSFEFKLKTVNSKRGVNFKDVGCGTSQVLPIVVQSLMAKDESLVILEQPEVHLHPKTQAELADFFVEIASQNKRFLLETHSDYLIERLRFHVAKGHLRPEDLFIYYVDYNPQTISSEVIRVEINSHGQYVNLPKGYVTNFRVRETKNMTEAMLKNLNEKEDLSKRKC